MTNRLQATSYKLQAQTVIFHGRSGCGKGTQVKLLADYLKEKTPNKEVLIIETGVRFRELKDGSTHTGALVRELLNKGGLPPEFIAIYLWAHKIIEEYDGDAHMLFDGFPRRIVEAAVLDGALRFYNKKQPAFVILNVSEEWSLNRLKERGRYDDKDALIARRLSWYDTEVVPALKYFRDNDFYQTFDINGEQTIDNVHKEILNALGL